MHTWLNPTCKEVRAFGLRLTKTKQTTT